MCVGGLRVLRYELFSYLSLWRYLSRASVCVCVCLYYAAGKKVSQPRVTFVLAISKKNPSTSRCHCVCLPLNNVRECVYQIRYCGRLWHRQQWRYKVVFCTITHTHSLLRSVVAGAAATVVVVVVVVKQFIYHQISFCLFTISIYNKPRWCVYYTNVREWRTYELKSHSATGWKTQMWVTMYKMNASIMRLQLNLQEKWCRNEINKLKPKKMKSTIGKGGNVVELQAKREGTKCATFYRLFRFHFKNKTSTWMHWLLSNMELPEFESLWIQIGFEKLYVAIECIYR